MGRYAFRPTAISLSRQSVNVLLQGVNEALTDVSAPFVARLWTLQCSSAHRCPIGLRLVVVVHALLIGPVAPRRLLAGIEHRRAFELALGHTDHIAALAGVIFE